MQLSAANAAAQTIARLLAVEPEALSHEPLQAAMNMLREALPAEAEQEKTSTLWLSFRDLEHAVEQLLRTPQEARRENKNGWFSVILEDAREASERFCSVTHEESKRQLDKLPIAGAS